MANKRKWSFDDDNILMEIPDNPQDYDFSMIEDYVQDVMKSMSKPVFEHRVKYKVSESSRFILVALQIPEYTNIHDWKISVNSTQMLIKYPPLHIQEAILLPSSVSSSRCTALFKNHILKVKLVKDPVRDIFRSVQIQS